MPIEALAASYKQQRDLLSFIKAVHQRRGYLTGEDLDRVAAAWDVPLGEVYGIATFYSFLGARPLGRNVVKVCKSTPCCLNHCDDVAREVQKELGIGHGQTTADGAFSLMLVNCIGACDRAPAMMVNDDVYQDVAPSRVREVLNKYSGNGRRRGPAPEGRK
ncbi:MAG: NADH-quinone oxidoreductase subunit NuoE [Chloroflexota bacterium]